MIEDKIMEGYKTIKKYIYAFETLMGVLFLCLAWEMARAAEMVCHSIFCLIPSAILVVSGIAAILFGLDAYFLRDDDDIWR
jgi:hypothetical protein